MLKNRFLTVAASAAGVSLIVQLLAFLRQLLIAAYFGVGRDYDGYVMVYTVANVIVFTFASIFDSIAVPHLVRAREQHGAKTAQLLAGSIFRFSLLLGAGMSVVLLIAVPLFAPIFATGFSPQERADLAKLAWYFLPWSLVCVPYYAAAARHKMEWHFNRVFFAEIVVVVVSTGFLVLRHGDIRMLPLAYAAGYGVGLVQLAAGIRLRRRAADGPSLSVRPVASNSAEMFAANQSNSLAALVDRHIQSFLAAGGIGAFNYSTQMVASLSTVLTLREVYMVPLTRQADRAERLTRLLSGLVLLAVPLAGLVALLAPEMVTVLLQHGRFNVEASGLTAQALRIGAFTLVSGSLFLPLLRMFQILDRIRLTHLLFLSLALQYAVFGYLFVIAGGLGIRGVALMQLVSSGVSAALAAYLLSRCGIRLRWRAILGWLAVAGAVAVIAAFAAAAALSGLEDTWLRLIVGGSAYGAVVLVCYFLARAQLRGIIFGLVPSRNVSGEHQ